MGKKSFWTREMGNPTGEEMGVPSQEGKDFRTSVAAAQLNTHKTTESRSVDLTNNGMVNHYLRDVDHGSHCLGGHRTTSLTYMSD